MRGLKTSSKSKRHATRSKRRNLAHCTTMQAALSHVTATCGVLARANCNHGFSISQPQGDRDSANCLALSFEFPLRLVVVDERFVDRVLASRVSVCRSENRTRESERAKQDFLDFLRFDKKKIPIRVGRDASYCEINYAGTRSFRRFIANVLKFFFFTTRLKWAPSDWNSELKE